MLALAAGWVLGRVISAGGDHRPARIVGFGATTMLCAIGGQQAAEELSVPVLLLPKFYQQVGTTAAFIRGLIGGVGAAMMRKPRNAPLALTLLLAVIAPAPSFAQASLPPAVPVDAVTAIVDAFKTHDLVAVSDAHGNAQNQAFLKALVSDPRFSAVANDIVWESGNARYWSAVRTREDHSRWLAMRVTYPAAVVQLEVLAKQRRALVVYGAVLYLGRQSTLTTTSPSGARCAEPGYLAERLRRIALTGIPAFEADRARQVCGQTQ